MVVEVELFRRVGERLLLVALTAGCTPSAPPPAPPTPPTLEPAPQLHDQAPGDARGPDIVADASCLRAEDCPSGVCEGLGCNDQEPGRCVLTQRMCTRDLRAFCGCDGRTFRASSTCPGQRYQASVPCRVDKTLP